MDTHSIYWEVRNPTYHKRTLLLLYWAYTTQTHWLPAQSASWALYSTAFKWNLHCHRLISLRQRQITIVMRSPVTPYIWVNIGLSNNLPHDDVIKWKHFPRNWPFVRGIHRSPVNSPHKGQWRGALMFSLMCARINNWVNNGEAGDLRRNRVHYDVIVMLTLTAPSPSMPS